MAGRVIYGVGPVRELLVRKARDIVVLYVRETRGKRDAVDDIARDARGRGVAVEERARGELDVLAGDSHHQGVVAVAGEYPYVAIEDIVSTACGGAEPALLVALDSVQDPHNLGAIVRSAYVLGAQGVIVPRDRAAGVTAAVTKASAGATEHMAIAQVTNLVRALEELKEAGVWLAAVTAGAGAQPIHELDASVPLCLVLGAEGTGIRALVSRTCDFHVDIPMAGAGVGSLNVSVAAGIALYEISRQRRLRSV
jgi:23S rRNA (guanosine2251-2'-O)-methyltransferase